MISLGDSICRDSFLDLTTPIPHMRIKQRESACPFPPVVVKVRMRKSLGERYEPPYIIIIVCQVRPEWKGRLSVATLEGGTGRAESAWREPKCLYCDMIKRFGAKSKYSSRVEHADQ
jgi:predicted NodU family carbamoyl transferase